MSTFTLFSEASPAAWPASRMPTMILGSFACWLLFKLVSALYNISPLHPLSHIPGPRLAAATYFPEFYWDVIKFGRYTSQIKAMHEAYGPIVRISPDEIHCNDPGFSDEIYAVGSRKRNKPKHQVNGTVLSIAEFGTVDHDLHKTRRAPVAKFFTRAKIARLEGEIKEYVQALCNKLLRQSGKGAFDFKTAYSCFTADIVSAYCFGQSFGFLDQEDWKPNFREPTEKALQTSHVFRWFTFLKHLDKLATGFVDYLPSDIALFVRTMQIELPDRVNKTREAMQSGLIDTKDRHTIFAEILFDEELESKEKGTQRIATEGFAVLGAGTETTASALAVVTYHLLKNPEQMARLRVELEDHGVAEDPRALPSYTDLEKLPYLSAVIKEGLRLSYGVSMRTARIATEEDLVYRGEWNKKDVEYVIPRGYAIGMSTAITHHDETIFPDSHKFLPERWLDAENKLRKEPEKGLMPFAKGSRACLASNMALCEIYLVIPALALRVWPRMSLFETTDEDVVYDYDMFIPMPKKGSRGMRAVVL